ncbi:unnamed protein product [Trichogramma brassicae]|uniref:Uncharacterized protein n=1 Tax=Trichogramma brassicae TaxID=86971 RepID=A0A6H5IJ38_9HYME|nr:unnamed protein product [Trichogramma brassicae]
MKSSSASERDKELIITFCSAATRRRRGRARVRESCIGKKHANNDSERLERDRRLADLFKMFVGPSNTLVPFIRALHFANLLLSFFFFYHQINYRTFSARSGQALRSVGARPGRPDPHTRGHNREDAGGRAPTGRFRGQVQGRAGRDRAGALRRLCEHYHTRWASESSIGLGERAAKAASADPPRLI